jgi:predicted transposase YdaD
MEKLTTDAREEGRLEGIAEGKLEGIAEGKTKGKIETLISLVANQTLSVTDAANFANMSVQNFSDLMTQR